MYKECENTKAREKPARIEIGLQKIEKRKCFWLPLIFGSIYKLVPISALLILITFIIIVNIV